MIPVRFGKMRNLFAVGLWLAALILGGLIVFNSSSGTSSLADTASADATITATAVIYAPVVVNAPTPTPTPTPIAPLPHLQDGSYSGAVSHGSIHFSVSGGGTQAGSASFSGQCNQPAPYDAWDSYSFGSSRVPIINGEFVFVVADRFGQISAMLDCYATSSTAASCSAWTDYQARYSCSLDTLATRR